MGRGELADTEWWDLIEPLLPPGRERAGYNCRFLNGVLHVVRVGCRCSDMHKRCGQWYSIYVRFRCWAEQGV